MKGDKVLTCGCGKTFNFSIGEQEFFKKKGFVEPKRCPDCRLKKKQERFDRESRKELPYPRRFEGKDRRWPTY